MDTDKSIHDKAIRLIEGGIVEIKGNWFKLKKLSDDAYDLPCIECELDSICELEHSEVCVECERILHNQCYLRLVSENK